MVVVAVTLTLLVPLVTAMVLLALRRHAPAARPVALGGAAMTAAAAVATVALRDEVDTMWVRSLGMRWSFAADGISAALVLLTALVGVLVVAHTVAGDSEHRSDSTFLGSLVLVEAGALAAFLARDALVFFVAFEVVLVPMWVLIRRYGDRHPPAGALAGDPRFALPVRPGSAPGEEPGEAPDNRADAAARFVLFTAFGSALLLVGLLVLTTSTGTSDLRVLADMHGAGLSPARQLTIAALLVLGLGVKVPLFGLHTWLPSAHTAAPTAGSVLLAAVLLKLGTYGLVRLVVPVVPDGLAQLAPALALLGAVGIVWAGLLCLVERDLKRLIAYSSVAHMGFVVIAVASGSQTGVQAALFANVAHGLVAALLFFVAGELKHRWGSADLSVVRAGLREVSPRQGLLLLVGLAASLGLPGLVSFWGEVLAVYAAWAPAPGRSVLALRCAAVAGVVGLALAAGYALRVARLVWAGEAPEGGRAASSPAVDLPTVELAVPAVLAGLVVLLGVWPNLVLGLSQAATAVLVGGGVP